MFRPLVNEFLLTLSSAGADGTRPVSNKGTAVTPGATNTYGSYASLGVVNPNDDAYWIWIYAHTVNVVAENRMVMITVGVDPAGGSSFTDTINDLLIGAPLALQSTTGGPIYGFPLRIKAGSAIGVKAACLSATTTAIRVYCELMCQPSRPELVRCGSFVQTFGVTPPTVGGVAVTPGGASEGAYAEIGTLDKPLWFFDFGYSIDDTTMTTASLEVDVALGDASNKRVIIPNAQIITTANEVLNRAAAGRFALGAPGDKIYARSQHSGTADTNNSVAVYGVGG